MFRAKITAPRVRGLVRPRISARLDEVWQRQVGVLVAPAGSGKTTALAHYAADRQVAAVWFRADASDGSAAGLVAHLAEALSGVLGAPVERSESIDAVLEALEGWSGSRLLVVVDNAWHLDASPAAAAVERLIMLAPPAVRVVLASRTPLALDLSGLHLAEEVCEVGADDLRFRSWEVERLFREVYDDPLPPEAVEELAARSGGWAAGLQMVHLSAPRGASARPLAASLTGQSRLVGPYLVRNVLAELPESLRGFVRDTCVLGVLTGPLCDQLRGAFGSAALLNELSQRQICGTTEQPGTYRYPPLLQDHLEQELTERLGGRVADRYRRAAVLLESAGAYADAVRAAARCDDWGTVRRLLQVHGEQVAASRRANWRHVLPAHLLDGDPWLTVAAARREYAAGRVELAVDLYDRAEQALSEGPARARCRYEREMVSVWSPRPPDGGLGWCHLLRAATCRAPREQARRALREPGAGALLAAGLATVLAGRLPDADALLSRAAAAPDIGPGGALAARLGRVAVRFCRTGRVAPAEVDALALDADVAGQPWLARVSRALLALGADPDGGRDAAQVRAECEADGDLWGALVVALLAGTRCLAERANPAAELERAVELARVLGAGVLESWARSLLAAALAFAHAPDAEVAARGAEAFARAAEVAGARGLALLALAACRPAGTERAELYGLARELIVECGLPARRLAAPAVPAVPPVPATAPVVPVVRRAASGRPAARVPGGRAVAAAVDLRLIGGFALRLAGREPDLAGLRPRARTTLRFLALHAGRPVHRETLLEALWPHLPVAAGMHSLQVAVSALRRALDPGPTRGSSRLLARDGDAYTLVLPEDGRCDLIEFHRAVRDGQRARDDPGRAGAALRAALRLYRGDLLPEDGPAEWVVAERERLRVAAAQAATALGALELARGDPSAAVRALERAIGVDPFRDGAWRLLLAAYGSLGDRAAAARARREYRRVLAELGLGSPLGEELDLGEGGVLAGLPGED